MKPKTKTINLMLLDGGVGDHIASLVAVNYILRKYPWITPLVWLPDYLVDFAKNILPEGTSVTGMSLLAGRYEPTRPTKTTAWDGHISPMKIHLLDYAFLRLCDENPDISEKNYLKVQFDKVKCRLFDLPNKYVVFTTGFTADVREWKAKSINETADYVISKGYTPVYLGQTQVKTGLRHTIEGKFNEEIDFTKGVNLIDKTSLLEATAIMNGAKAVLGVDNGLIHVAGCTNAVIIAGYTTVSPQARLPIRNSVLGYDCFTVLPDVSCRFCQQNTNFLYGHDYKKCYQIEPSAILKCVDQMTAAKFIAHLEGIL